MTAVDEWESLVEDVVDDLSDLGVSEGVDQIKLVREWAEKAADLYVQHQVFGSMHMESAVQQIEDVCYANKSQIKEAWENALQEARVENEDRPRVNEWLREHVEEVVIHRTTDHRQRTEWEWRLDIDGTITTSHRNNRATHLSWDNLQDLIYVETEDLTADPPKIIRGGADWDDWITEFIHDRSGDPEEAVGPRTETTHSIFDHIEQSNAYTDLVEAASRDAMHLDEDGLLYIPSNEIHTRREDRDVSAHGLQIELSARGVLADEINGAATELDVTIGEYPETRHYWVVDTGVKSIPDPARIDPDSPAEQVADDKDDEDEDLQLAALDQDKDRLDALDKIVSEHIDTEDEVEEGDQNE